jgi:hypothetical protein
MFKTLLISSSIFVYYIAKKKKPLEHKSEKVKNKDNSNHLGKFLKESI